MKTENREPDFFVIDKNALDREWTAQPALYHKYARRLADAQQELQQAETALEIGDAEIDAKIRRHAEKAETKLTEAAIKNQILVHEKHVASVAKVHDARHKVDILRAAVSTLDHRKRALENLVDLRLADYFSEPRARGDAARDIDERTKRRARGTSDE